MIFHFWSPGRHRLVWKALCSLLPLSVNEQQSHTVTRLAAGPPHPPSSPWLQQQVNMTSVVESLPSDSCLANTAQTQGFHSRLLHFLSFETITSAFGLFSRLYFKNQSSFEGVNGRLSEATKFQKTIKECMFKCMHVIIKLSLRATVWG